MKKQQYVFLLLAAMVALIGFSTSTMVAQNKTIQLEGSLAMIKNRSLLLPFAVTQDASFITVDYLQTLSNITIAIEGEQGEVIYSVNVNPVSGAELVIDIFYWEAGFYTIYISNATGGLLYGEFEIE